MHGYIQVTFRLLSGYFGLLSGYFGLLSGYFQVTFRLLSGYIQVTFRLHPGYIQVTSRLLSLFQFCYNIVLQEMVWRRSLSPKILVVRKVLVMQGWRWFGQRA